MALLDFILNGVGLLLWLGWRAIGLDRASKPAAMSLASVLKRAEARPIRTLTPLLFLLLLLIVRSFVYWALGPSVHWVPTLDLGVIASPLRAEYWSRMLLFSFASFFRLFAVAYLWLLFLAIASRPGSQHDPVQPLLESIVGAPSRWPWLWVTLATPLVGAIAWVILQPALQWLDLTGQTTLPTPVWQQALAFGLCLLLSWAVPATLLILVHAINSYVYVGSIRWWHLAARAGRNLVRWLPLAIGKFDLAPIVGITLALLIAHFGSRALIRFFHVPLFE